MIQINNIFYIYADILDNLLNQHLYSFLLKSIENNIMKKLIIISLPLILFLFSMKASSQKFEKDVFPTSAGNLTITFIGHGTLMFEIDNKVIHIDPTAMFADYSTLPKADLILITHEHADHFDMATIDKISKKETEIILTTTCKNQLQKGKVMKNGDSYNWKKFIHIQAVPAYNIQHKTNTGQLFHPKGQGNGYILTFGNFKVYVAGDTENIPEMKSLKDIDVAFLPMNLPYTMTPKMTADAALSFMPKILYPYHYGNTNTNELVNLLKNRPEIEVRIRKLN